MLPPWPDCLPPLGAGDLTIPPGCEPPQPPPECLQPLVPGDIRPSYCYNYSAHLLPPLQPRPTPHPFWQGVKGFVEVSEAVLNSKLHQWDDGMVFGFSGSASSLMVPAGISSPEHIKNWILAFNNVCLPSTGLTKGIEIVYDFKHQERGIFDYDGNVLNVGTVANAGITHITELVVVSLLRHLLDYFLVTVSWL